MSCGKEGRGVGDERQRSQRMGMPSVAGQLTLAFATGACCIAALALAFSLGRHWPLGMPHEAQAGVPSLSEVRSRGAIPYSELNIDRGTEPDKSPRASAAEFKVDTPSDIKHSGEGR